MTVSLFLTRYISSVIPSSVVEFGFFVIIDHVSSCTAGSWREERIRICKTVLYAKDYCKIKTGLFAWNSPVSSEGKLIQVCCLLVRKRCHGFNVSLSVKAACPDMFSPINRFRMSRDGTSSVFCGMVQQIPQFKPAM